MTVEHHQPPHSLRQHAHHSHAPQGIATWRLVLTIALNFTITAAELIGGLLSGSLSLISDALHNASDGIAIIISLVALRLAQRPRDERYTFGLKRAQVLAALINAGVLIAISVFLLREALLKFSQPVQIEGRLMLMVASIGLLANLLGTWLLSSGAKGNLNLRAAYLHLLSDALSSFGVILGAVAIWQFQWFWIDPLLTVLIAVYVGWQSWKIIREAVDMLMLKVPSTITISALREALHDLPGIPDLHHVHIWQLDDNAVMFEAHVRIADVPISATAPLAAAIEDKLQQNFSINHVTLQFECAECVTGQLNQGPAYKL